MKNYALILAGGDAGFGCRPRTMLAYVESQSGVRAFVRKCDATGRPKHKNATIVPNNRVIHWFGWRDAAPSASEIRRIRQVLPKSPPYIGQG